MPKTLSAVVKVFLIFTSLMLLISLIFNGFIFNLLQRLLLGSIVSLALSLYAQSKEQQAISKKS
jgi:hypothetical protein